MRISAMLYSRELSKVGPPFSDAGTVGTPSVPHTGWTRTSFPCCRKHYRNQNAHVSLPRAIPHNIISKASNLCLKVHMISTRRMLAGDQMGDTKPSVLDLTPPTIRLAWQHALHEESSDDEAPHPPPAPIIQRPAVYNDAPF